MKSNRFSIVACCLATCLLSRCQPGPEPAAALFQLLAAKETGIDFQNTITPTAELNLLDFEYLYNGGGVGVGDFNNDGLPDLVFTGSQVASKLYLNEGDFRFRDISAQAGFDTAGKWCTGVAIVDINQDGLDDIYVSVGGPGNRSQYPNLLFVNQGDATFVEAAADYGLDAPDESNQAVFFDYDRDGDLDCYLLNGGGFEKSAVTVRPILTGGQSRNTDRLYRNDYNEALGHAVFTDISAEAGIGYEGFGLGVAILDVNRDGYPDLYVSNDYLSRDLLYRNNQDGTFTEAAEKCFDQFSHFSMGNDVGDINNDGYWDLVTLDMLPASHFRRKMMFGPDSRDKFQQAERYGYGRQYMRNMLHLGTARGDFSEIGQLAGIDRTDWSWAPLLADFDNDGRTDLYVTNGYGKDITDLDYVKFRQDAVSPFGSPEAARQTLLASLAELPAIVPANYLFRNAGDYRFADSTARWGLDRPSISNGAVYVDLDRDGDLELVTNNSDQPAFIYRNYRRERDTVAAHYLRIELNGSPRNRRGIGTTVSVYHGATEQHRYQQPVRGFQSSIGTALHFGLGVTTQVDSVILTWPDGTPQRLLAVAANQTLHVDYRSATPITRPIHSAQAAPLLRSSDRIAHRNEAGVPADDFKVQPLLLHGFTQQGPGLAVGDVNGDGLEDLFVGGAYGTAARLFLQTPEQTFRGQELPSETYEDLGAVFCDLDGDTDLDLYVTSGGSERYAGHRSYQDRVYRNDGTGHFTHDTTALPEMHTSTAAVTAADFDGDGSPELFVGGRVVPGQFPTPPRSYLLKVVDGRFTDVTEELAPGLHSVGMVTAAVWTDFDNDHLLDLIVVGELMPVTVFQNDGRQLRNVTAAVGLERSTGLWNSIEAADLDNDGDTDYVLGNVGWNTPYTITPEHPLRLHYADFDDNGSVDPIYSVYEDGAYHPLASLDVLAQQLPQLKKQFLKYAAYAAATTDDVLELLGNPAAATLTGERAASMLLENSGDGQLISRPLPTAAQLAPVKGTLAEDLNGDGYLDLVLVGNETETEVRYGQYAASRGTVLLNRGDLNFAVADPTTSGFLTSGDQRALAGLWLGTGERLLVAGTNNGVLQTYEVVSYPTRERLSWRPGEVSAILHLPDGGTRKVERRTGGGYLSQSSPSIGIYAPETTVTFFDAAGRPTRNLDTPMTLNDQR